MPVKRDAVVKPKTALELAVDQQLEEMFERASTDEAKWRERTVALIQLDRELEPDEQAELAGLIERYKTRRAKERERSRRFDAAVDKRQAKHPDESRGDSAFAVVLKRIERDRRRDERREEREAERERELEQKRAETAARAARKAARAAPSESAAPDVSAAHDPAEEPRRRRPRVKYGIVRVDDANGNRLF